MLDLTDAVLIGVFMNRCVDAIENKTFDCDEHDDDVVTHVYDWMVFGDYFEAAALMMAVYQRGRTTCPPASSGS